MKGLDELGKSKILPNINLNIPMPEQRAKAALREGLLTIRCGIQERCIEMLVALVWKWRCIALCGWTASICLNLFIFLGK